MISKLFAAAAIVLFATPLTFDSYEVAKSKSDISKENLIVVIGASWCSPCRKMHKEIVANSSAYKGVNLAFVDYDSAQGKKLYSGNSVPAIIKFKWDGSKWIRSVKVGYQSQRNLLRWVKQ